MSEEETGKEAFLDRWSRRKIARTEEKPSPPQTAEAPPAQPLPPVADLTPDSDFKPFMNPQVDAGTRRSALKKLFADVHFSTPDPFEPYSIDLTGEDPIPEEMLKTLDHAKRVLFEEKEQVAQAQEQAAQAPAQAQVSPQSQSHEPDLKDVAGKQDA